LSAFTPTYSASCRWRRRHIYPTINAQQQAWLLDTGSLTQKLVKKSVGTFNVAVLSQSITSASFSENRTLGIAPRRWALVREVVLNGNQKPWVYARTVIPLKTLKGRLRRLHFLGNQSLGEALFNDATMQREDIFITRLHRASIPMTGLYPEKIWGRHSVFRLSNKPLLVSEFFLPAIFTPHNTH